MNGKKPFGAAAKRVCLPSLPGTLARQPPSGEFNDGKIVAPQKPFISFSGNETLRRWDSCQRQRDKYLVIFVNESTCSGDVGDCFRKNSVYTYQMKIVGFSKRSNDFLFQNVPQQREN